MSLLFPSIARHSRTEYRGYLSKKEEGVEFNNSLGVISLTKANNFKCR